MFKATLRKSQGRGALMLASSATVWAMAVPAAIAQTWPDKPIRIIVPYPAGGATDLASRSFAKSMGKRLNNPFVIDNKGGAAGSIGMEAAATSAPDGYSFIVGTASTFAVNPHLYKQIRYDAEKSFTPICMMASAPVVMFANASLPASSLAEVVEWSKKNPGKLNYATDGTASIPHMGGERLKQLTGLDMTHVPYKGSASATQAVVAGDTQLAITGVANAIDFVRTGRLKIIGIAGVRRLILFPSAPTLIEQGVKGFDLGSWFAMFGPAKLDTRVVEVMGKACREAAAEPEIRDNLNALALEVLTSTPEQLRDQLTSDLKRWGDIVTNSGVRIE